jgi:DegV family protein with EDD domain
MEMDQRIAIATDSSCDLSDEVLAQYGISIIPLRIVYADREYRDRVEVDAQYVYERLDEELPTSSMPSLDDITSAWDAIADEGYTHLLQISISSGLSGTYNAMRMCAEEYTRMQVTVYDSRTLSMALGLMVLSVAREIQKSGSIPKAIARMDRIRGSMLAAYVVRTLEYLSKGGRIGKVEGIVGTLLRICPVISVNDDGVYYPMSKTVGYRKSLESMKKEFKARFTGKEVELAVVHGGAEALARDVERELRGFAKVKESFISAVSPVLGAHTGPGLIGIIAFEV